MAKQTKAEAALLERIADLEDEILTIRRGANSDRGNQLARIEEDAASLDRLRNDLSQMQYALQEKTDACNQRTRDLVLERDKVNDIKTALTFLARTFEVTDDKDHTLHIALLVANTPELFAQAKTSKVCAATRVCLELLRDHKKIQAIKHYRIEFGIGLKEAKEAVEALAVKHGMNPFLGRPY